MNPYIAHKNELKARLEIQFKTFIKNPSAFNYNKLDNTLLLYQDHIKNVEPDTYNRAAQLYGQGKV